MYGRPEWEREFPPAEWLNDRIRTGTIVCPVNPGHQRAAPRQDDLVIVLDGPHVGDFHWTWYGECMITDRTLRLLNAAGFTGFEVRPVTVGRIKRPQSDNLKEIPRLWELIATGKGGNVSPESGIHLVSRCEGCGLVRYSSYGKGIIVDGSMWDRSDFFSVYEYPGIRLITDKVKDFILNKHLTNCMLVPSEQLRWPKGVVKPEELR